MAVAADPLLAAHHYTILLLGVEACVTRTAEHLDVTSCQLTITQLPLATEQRDRCSAPAVKVLPQVHLFGRELHMSNSSVGLVAEGTARAFLMAYMQSSRTRHLLLMHMCARVSNKKHYE